MHSFLWIRRYMKWRKELVLHGALLASGSDIAQSVQAITESQPFVRFARIHSQIPDDRELRALVQTPSLDFVMIDCEAADDAFKAAAMLREFAPRLGLVGFRCRMPKMAREMDLIPIAGFLSESEALNAIQAAIRVADQSIFQNVRAFLPGKAGAGASTVALNIAGYLVQSGHARRVLLIEGDLRSGIIGALLDVKPQRLVSDVLHDADSLDTAIWNTCVTQKRGVDLMLTSREEPAHLPQWYDYLHLLRYVSTRYEHVILDFPEVINGAMIEALRRAGQTCVVTTPEVPCLNLTSARIDQLKNNGIEPGALKTVVNRWQRMDLPPGDIASLSGAAIETVLPNDYASVRS